MDSELLEDAERLMRIAEQAEGIKGYGVTPAFVNELKVLLAASNKALLLRVREGLPELMSEYFDDAGMEKFSGWNDYRTQALAVIAAEFGEV